MNLQISKPNSAISRRTKRAGKKDKEKGDKDKAKAKEAKKSAQQLSKMYIKKGIKDRVSIVLIKNINIIIPINALHIARLVIDV